MSPNVNSASRKRPVNLLLNEETVQHARRLTPNLSATVEGLLADYVARQEHASEARQRQADEVADAWNRFHAAHGALADEHSTL
ncbi:MAG: type II toxin-antitoxin system CcdA family antitoxin [Betaproteobacteria bacterium]|nr:type II toxin-antitoxin system CcdA family antitoxin [Betaproteobacteria bacterium]